MDDFVDRCSLFSTPDLSRSFEDVQKQSRECNKKVLKPILDLRLGAGLGCQEINAKGDRNTGPLAED